MADLAKKFGIKPGYSICVLGASPEASAQFRAGSPPGASLFEELGEAPYNLIFFWPHSLEGLTGQFTELQSKIQPDGAIWAVMPKKKYARQRGVDFTWEELQAAGLQTDLVDNKIASLTEEEYGTRFVIRKERRPKYSKA